MKPADYLILSIAAATALNAAAVENTDAARRIYPIDRQKHYIPDNDPTCNYVSTAVLHNPGGPLDNRDSMTVTTEYFDGFGRPSRTATQGSSSGRVIVTSARDYDAMGRVSREYLPFNVNDTWGGRSDAMTMLTRAYGDEAAASFAAYSYEGRLTGGSVTLKSPGEAWHAGPGQVEKQSVYIPGDLKLYHITPTGGLSSGSYYGAGELMVATITDEDGNKMEKVTDLSGTLLRTVSYPDASTPCVTDYLYNLRGELVCIVTPAGYELLAGLSAKELVLSWRKALEGKAYFYKYDEMGRMVSRTVPGGGEEQFIYDRGGRAILSRDGNLREAGKARFALYDMLGRPAVSGIVTLPPTTDWATLAGNYADLTVAAYPTTEPVGTFGGYSDVELAATDTVFSSVTYYDNYEFLRMYPAVADSLAYQTRPGFSEAFTDGGSLRRTGNLPTGSITFDTEGRNPELSVFYYDAEGRLVQTHRSNRLGGYNHTYMRLRGDGVLLAELREHSVMFNGTRPLPYLEDRHSDYYEYTYDHGGHPTLVTLRHDAEPVQVLNKCSYDDLGRPLYSRFGNEDKLSLGYRYTMRGEVSTISGNLFAEMLNYDKRRDGSTGYLAGKISGITWRTWEKTGLTDRYYDYTYDGAGRLTAAVYKDFSADGARGKVELVNKPDFSEYYTFDKFSNLTSIRTMGLTDRQTLADGSQRYTYGTVNDYSFTYSGARMALKFTGSIPDLTAAVESPQTATSAVIAPPVQKIPVCEYDANGNLTRSLFPAVSVMTYDINNRLNFAKTVDTSGEGPAAYCASHLSGADGSIRRSYYYRTSDTSASAPSAAAPRGLAALVNPSVRDSILFPGGEVPMVYPERTVEYCGDYRYDYDGVFAALPAVTLNLPQGYRDSDGWHFYLRDHLGSVRVVAKPDKTVEEFYHYYPYGEVMAESSYSTFKAQRFTGKEADTYLGATTTDNAARFLFNKTGRFNSPDRLAENTPAVTPYLLCGADPVNHTDPSGNVWVHRQVNGEDHYFYARHISNRWQYEKYYGYWDDNIEFLEDGYVATLNGTHYTFYNDEKDDLYGRVAKNGEFLPMYQLILGDGFLIGGVLPDNLDAGSLYRNLMGTTYVGPNNPKKYGYTVNGYIDVKQDSYSYPPKSMSDLSAYIHDQGYDMAGAKGPYSAFLDNSLAVMSADKCLVQCALFGSIINNSEDDAVKCACIAIAFQGLVSIKKQLTHKTLFKDLTFLCNKHFISTR